jgi:hypothetical protein
MRSELGLGGAGEAARCIDDFRSAAVVEGNAQRDALIAARELLSPPHAVDKLGRHWIRSTTDEPHTHALGMQLRRFSIDPPREHGHQPGHLLVRPAPVLGRERVHGQLAHIQVDRVPQTGFDGVCAGLVPRKGRQSPALRPTAIAVGDDRHVSGALAGRRYAHAHSGFVCRSVRRADRH